MTDLSTGSEALRANVRSHRISTLLARTVSMGAFCAGALVLFRYPLGATWLALGISIYTLVLIYYPLAWLIVIPALLPVLDLAPWTGWFFLDEFDLFVIVTFAVSLWRREGLNTRQRLTTPFCLVLSMVALSYAISLVIGLFPLDPLDANAFSNYYSHYNSLRVAKGFVWACALLPFVLRFLRTGTRDRYKILFAWGMVLGLTGVVLAVIRERFLFSGILNFNADFRTTATFSGLHNGGNDIEAYIVLAQPFIVAWIMFSPNLRTYLGALILFGLSTYSLLVTFSRAGYVGLAFSWILLLVFLFNHRRQLISIRPSLFALGTLLSLGVALLSIIPVFEPGSYIRARFSTTQRDWETRVQQSKNTVRMMDDNWQTRLFGMGLGRYPITYYKNNPSGILPATYRYENDPGNLYLRLFPGRPLYMGQWIHVEPHQRYRLSLSLRGPRLANLHVPICEKSLLYSFRCVGHSFKVDLPGVWENKEVTFEMGPLGNDIGWAGLLLRRPVELALYNAGPVLFDVDNIELLDSSGKNKIVNGDFSQGGDRWFFSVDDHLSWQNKNHWIQLFFEKGWFGLIAFNLFAAYTLIVLLRAVLQGDRLSLVLLSSLAGFLTVGWSGDLFHTPRMAMLFYLTTFIASGHRMVASSTRS